MDGERRKHRREPTKGVARYRGGDGLEALELCDLSVGGLRLTLSGPETVGRDVELSLQLPDRAGEVQVKGRVVWARQASPYSTGIRFFTPLRGLRSEG